MRETAWRLVLLLCRPAASAALVLRQAEGQSGRCRAGFAWAAQALRLGCCGPLYQYLLSRYPCAWPPTAGRGRRAKSGTGTELQWATAGC